MEKFDYSTLSLKSLRTLKLIYEQGSLTAAAIELGQNQPAVSYTLEQMREALHDPLFVRSGRGGSTHQSLPPDHAGD
ncbi:helix-turn-helix domain-containing protein [Amphritea pacifica]|uniref:LysR family transcriptional regulator n=1 Tax=Amphritea pacifica TaxID=2811233 RepID=A0ABS2W2W1_9GAMM|nr:LysR family transcriptional regulator [Amphritea pacifica]MBN0985941.1 LysR family transcriptional regulator [Amphritea pacifica]